MGAEAEPLLLALMAVAIEPGLAPTVAEPQTQARALVEHIELAGGRQLHALDALRGEVLVHGDPASA